MLERAWGWVVRSALLYSGSGHPRHQHDCYIGAGFSIDTIIILLAGKSDPKNIYSSPWQNLRRKQMISGMQRPCKVLLVDFDSYPLIQNSYACIP